MFNNSLSKKLLLDEAKKRNIIATNLYETGFFQLKYNSHTEFLYDTVTSKTTIIASKITKDKDLTKRFLSAAKISIAKGLVINDDYPIENIKDKLTYPVVVKPLNGTHGDAVYTNIETREELLNKVKLIKRKYNSVLVEEQFIGKEYRIFASKDKFISAVNRIPANVCGDGINTVYKLIQIKNNDPRRGNGYDKSLLKIKIDDSVIDYLNKQKIDLNDIPKKNQIIMLRKNSNLSTGGDSIDVTKTVHESVKEIAVRAVGAIPDLAYAGVDFMTKDITQEQAKDSYIVIELNVNPMISMHHFPFQGESQDVAQEIINQLFPETIK